MPYLLLHGNINPKTFANTIVAANEKSKVLFEKKPLDRIFVIHSKESERVLSYNRDEWVTHLAQHGIDYYDIDGKVIEIADSSSNSIERFVSHIEFLFNGIGGDKSGQWIVDLTNGTSIQKNLLSICSYILNIKHQYMINIEILSKLTSDRGFLPPTILNECYESAPDSTLMDGFAYLDLSEMVRYKQIIGEHTSHFSLLRNGQVDKKFFYENLVHATKLKLEGDKKNDYALFRIASTSIAASIEELVTELSRDLPMSQTPATFGTRLKAIESKLSTLDSDDFDHVFFQKFKDMVLYLRNSTTHKSKTMSKIEQFKADLSLKITFPFLAFCIDIIQPLLANGDNLPQQSAFTKQIRLYKTEEDFTPAIDCYYGLDGDNTGSLLEGMFLNEQSSESGFSAMSKNVSNAINKISKMIKNNRGNIIFEAGDDLLFKGKFSPSQLREMQSIYKEMTGSSTCSIAVGRTLHETYLAMKLAKATPGKGIIMGIELMKDEKK